MNSAKTPDTVSLPASFSETERGNVWLTTEDGTGHNIWIGLGNDNRLEIAIRVENYPGLNVATIKVTDAELAQHIRQHCGGMIVRKLNVDGLEDISGEIPEPESE
jgi:hypothetical protein